MADDDDVPEAWKPKAWWDDLDVQVRAAWIALADEEGLELGDYHGAGRVLERFGREYPKLAAALAERFSAPEVTDPEEAWKLGLAMWMSENLVGETFARSDDSAEQVEGA